MRALSICHLYPDLLNLYGDRGNMITIRKRCEWRGISVRIDPVSIGDPFDAEKYDVVFIGGGQDYEQKILRSDFLQQKGSEIKNYIANGGVLLAICGGYQLLGNFYRTAEGEELKFLGALDFATYGGKERITGNFAFRCEFLKSEHFDGVVAGFENHSGRTFLGSGVRPLGRVLKGFGNNGKDHTEGAMFQNTICSYGHGSLLPKNPALADYLIDTAFQRKYGEPASSIPLDDTLENLAHEAACRKSLRV